MSRRLGFREFIKQFIKFGIVGLLAFAIDYGLFVFMENVLGINYLVSSITSFIVATIFNYAGSMRYVFQGRTGQTRMQQFVIFTVLSVIGLGLNSFFLWVCVDVIGIYPELGKLIATFLVMIYNFITRKWFFEDHTPRRARS